MRPFTLVDAATGARHPLAPPACPSRLPYPRPRVEKLRFRAEMAEPGEGYDQLGYALISGYRAPEQDAAQGELFADHSIQPDASDGEPVFWQESAGDEPGFYPDEAPSDDGIQADAEVD